MSTISALKVFSFLGSQRRGSSGGDSPPPPNPVRLNAIPSCFTMAGDDDASAPPPWFANAMIKTQDELKQTIRDELGGLKADVAGLKTDFAAMKDKQQIQATNIRDVDRRLDDAFEEIAKLKALIEGKVAFPAPVPTSCSVREQCSVDVKFKNLLKQASAMSGCYAAGHVPADPITGVRPSVKPFKQIVATYFPGFKLKVLASAGISKIVQFTVEQNPQGDTPSPDFEAVLKNSIISIRGDGWWFQQELPPTLRQMYSNAYKFFKETKSEYPVVRPFMLDVVDGYATIDETKVVPVCLIPKNKAVWKQLGGVLQNIVASFLTMDWLDSMAGKLTVEQLHIDEWLSILGEKSELPSVSDPRAFATLRDDSMETDNGHGNDQREG